MALALRFGPDTMTSLHARARARWTVLRLPARRGRGGFHAFVVRRSEGLLLSRAHARRTDIEELWPARDHRDRRDHGPEWWRGPRETRTTRPSGGHYLYESRDPPKSEGKAARPGSRPAGLVSGGPLSPAGPWSRRSRWSRGCRRPLSAASYTVSSFGRRVSGFGGRRWLPRRDHLRTWSRHSLRRHSRPSVARLWG
jgi:hypothetical protein